MHTNPEAVLAREESRTKYEGLSGGRAAALAREVFPAELNDVAGGPPPLPEGERITGFADSDAAQVELAEGQQGLVESTMPMAIASSPGHFAAINLGVSEEGGALGRLVPS